MHELFKEVVCNLYIILFYYFLKSGAAGLQHQRPQNNVGAHLLHHGGGQTNLAKLPGRLRGR